MARPFCPRRIARMPGVVYFKPAGIPLRELEEQILTLDELEALRLADAEGKQHVEGARIMGVSRQTFSRILARARHTVATCLASGKALRIEGGAIQVAGPAKHRSAR
jgi:predicted DNA-binding protein (UPF0251 family)